MRKFVLSAIVCVVSIGYAVSQHLGTTSDAPVADTSTQTPSSTIAINTPTPSTAGTNGTTPATTPAATKPITTTQTPAAKPVVAPTPVATPTPISNPTPTPAPTPVVTPAPVVVAKPKGQYADGTYTGAAADAYYGTVQVQAVVQDGALASVTFLQYPSDRRTSQQINSRAMPILKSEAIQAQSANVSGVSGATHTSEAFIQSLGDALAQAKNS